MQSFYGGKQGRTYHIIKTYNSVEEKANYFAQGSDYAEVNYDEYILTNPLFKDLMKMD